MKPLFGLLAIIFGILFCFYVGWGLSQVLLGMYDAMSYRFPKDEKERDSIRRARNKIAICFGAIFCVILAILLFASFREFVYDLLFNRDK
jgi:hypothetical protein